jgi:hypothetical protein
MSAEVPSPQEKMRAAVARAVALAAVSGGVASGAELLGQSAGSWPHFTAGTGAVLGAGIGAVAQSLIDSAEARLSRRDEFAYGLAYLLEEDAHDLVGRLRENPVLQNLLWDSVQAAMSAADQNKRLYLARVVANAVSDDAKIDDAQFTVNALRELEGPHIRALVKLIAAEYENRKDPGNNDEILQEALSAQPSPVKATLIRLGVVLVGSQPDSTSGLYSIPRAENYSISGVNDFGRRIIRELQEIETN